MSDNQCQYMVGFTEKTICGEPVAARCVRCKVEVCEKHVISTSDGMMCLEDASWEKSDDVEASKIVEYPEQDSAFWDDIS